MTKGSLEEIRDLLKRFTEPAKMTFPASVVSVDQDSLTCVVKPGNEPELKARLKSAIDEKSGKFVLIPKVGSTVLVSIIGNDDQKAYVSSFGEIDQMHVEIGDQSFEMTEDGFKFNGGENGGLIIFQQLLNEYNKTRSLLDAIAGALNEWVPAPTDGGTALKTLITAALAGKESGDFGAEGIINDQVKH